MAEQVELEPLVGFVLAPFVTHKAPLQFWGGYFFVIVLPKSNNITLYFDCPKYLLNPFMSTILSILKKNLFK